MSSKVTISVDTEKVLDNLFIKAIATYLVVVTIVDSRKNEDTFYNNLFIRMIIFTVFFLSVFGLHLPISALVSVGIVIMSYFFIDA